MRLSGRTVLAFIAAATLALPVSGKSQSCRTTETAASNHQKCVSLPYTAQYKITHLVKEPDGTTITHESTEVEAADSEGRWMTATTRPDQPEAQTSTTQITVADFVANTRSSWQVPGKMATVTPMHRCSTTKVPRTKPPAELLGTQTIHGIEAKGRRVTWNRPAGEPGNAAAIVRTSETWFAAAPGLWTLLVRSISDSPRAKTTTELVNLNRSEPDPAMFRPPEGYEIVNQSVPPCPTESPNREAN